MPVLRPLNLIDVMASVNRTGRLIIVDTGFRTYGVGAEITSQVVSQCFSSLKQALVRLGLPDHPNPSSRVFFLLVSIRMLKAFFGLLGPSSVYPPQN